MTSYPKIETLYDRDAQTFKVIKGKYRRPEFGMIDEWYCTEKIHGTDIRVMIGPLDVIPTGEPTIDEHLLETQVFHLGRTDRAQVPDHLLQFLEQTYTVDTMLPALEKAKGAEGAIFYMEGYGYKIQEGGNYCGKSVSTRLFDVFIMDMNGPAARTLPGENQSAGGWWLEPEQVKGIASKIGVETVPYLGKMSTEEIVEIVKGKPTSIVADTEGGNKAYQMEGIVARTIPLLLRRTGERIIWKLKGRDFK